jgi:hypothetical protein
MFAERPGVSLWRATFKEVPYEDKIYLLDYLKIAYDNRTYGKLFEEEGKCD